MAEARMLLPVFLPDSNLEWKEIKGVATITDEGEINMVLQQKEDAINLVKHARNGTLFCVHIAYIADRPAVEKTEKT